MRLLHTSDWHIGRTFHGHSTVEHLRQVLDALVDTAVEREVDVVLVAGDVFDSATPAADFFEVLTSTFRRLVAAGVTVVVTSGNHDSATRLGFQSEFASLAGIHVVTRPEAHAAPIELSDEHGPVSIYGIPYLEPALIRHRWPEVPLRTQAQAIAFAMENIRADLATRPARSVVISHCFVANVAETQEHGLERDITAGGLDVVPLATFDGVDYAALGHIHGRAELAPNVRYSGAPLHYSFKEAHKERGAWLVELDAGGLERVEWVALPVPRRLTRLSGEIDELLADPQYAEFEQDWVEATLTDQARPLDAMRRLQSRFPFCANLEFRPAIVAESAVESYAARMRGRSDAEIVGDFLSHVRNGVGPTEAERAAIAEVVS